MRELFEEKKRAIGLRKAGMSYNDISKKVHVSKSSLSLWLRDLPLTADEKAYLKGRVDSNISRGRIKAATAHRRSRLDRERLEYEEAKLFFTKNFHDPFFLLGIGLYWAEGTKRNGAFEFINSDDEMLVLMLRWIEKFFLVPRSEIKVRLYIHKPYAHERCEEQWSRALSIPIKNFQKTVFKPTGRLVKKRPLYKGCLRIELGKVSRLRKMQFWQKMLFAHFVK